MILGSSLTYHQVVTHCFCRDYVLNASFSVDEENDDSQLENIVDQENSDSDEAPNEVHFSKAKDEALSLQKLERAARLEIQEAMKSKKRKKEEMLIHQKEQKAQKMQMLASKRLPDEILDQVSSNSKPLLGDDEPKLNKKKTFSSHKGIMIYYRKFHCLIKTFNVILELQKTLFSSLPVEGPTTFQVAVLQSKKWKKKFMPASSQAASFREQVLSKGVKRQSSKLYCVKFVQTSSSPFLFQLRKFFKKNGNKLYQERVNLLVIELNAIDNLCIVYKLCQQFIS